MKKPLSSLALRLISSAILIPLVVGVIYIGGWPYAILAALCIGIAIAEWVNISRHMPFSATAKTALIALGLAYLGASFAQMTTLRLHDTGEYWTLVFMLSIWASDSGAYLFGKTIGGPKMSPTISPNKTWSGYAGALLFPALILTICVYGMFPYGVPLTATIIGGLLIGITGQSGDLLISALKRKAGLKDTGALIPGHGGILDRIDALILALPVYLAFVKFVAG